MDRLIKFLQVIYYFIWIPLGLLLIAGIVFLIVANPLAKLGEFGGPGGGFPGGAPGQGGSGGGAGGFPSQEQIEQFQRQGGPKDFNQQGP